MSKKNLEVLKKGGVGVIATDTLLGIVGLALNKRTVERIYKIKDRTKTKPFIILVGSINDLNKFNIRPSKETRKTLKKYWPGKVSIVLSLKAKSQKLKAINYLHRGKKALAFRLPEKKSLRELLKKTGPLVAPSTNPEGKKPARNIKEAKKYFGERVDFYESMGYQKRNSKPSTLIKIEKGKEIILRQ